MKVVYDTCVYIDFLRSGRREEIFLSRHHIRYLSPIVMMELEAGARISEQKSALDRLFLPYSKAQRVIGLQANHFFKAGECLARIRAKRRDIHLGLSHDVLIAISALSLGATLHTSNRRDFSMIGDLLPVKIEFV